MLLPGKSHGQRSLVGCSAWGHEESNSTEWLHFHFLLSCIGEGNGNPLQCSCLENPRDGGAWWAAVYGVAQSWTRLKWLSNSSSGSHIFHWWQCYMGSCLKESKQFLKRLSCRIVQQLQSEVNSREIKAYPHKNVYTKFMAEVFTIAKSGDNRQPKYLSTKEWTGKMSFLHTRDIIWQQKEMKYWYMLQHELWKHYAQWIRSQSQENVYCMIPLIWNVQTARSVKTEGRFSDCLRAEGLGRNGGGLIVNECGACF